MLKGDELGDPSEEEVKWNERVKYNYRKTKQFYIEMMLANMGE